MRQKIAEALSCYLSSLSNPERIEVINFFRQLMHKYSPFNNQPIDCVLWVKEASLVVNSYNPNNVAPQEKKLLLKSLETDGFTQPLVVSANFQGYEIVDGFHRYDLVRNKSVILEQLSGYLPVTCLRDDKQCLLDRMASTIRHNRARGRHRVNAMSEIIRELSLSGWSNEKIGCELGMDSDEVLRLKQINGLIELFADRTYSESWTVNNK